MDYSFNALKLVYLLYNIPDCCSMYVYNYLYIELNESLDG